MSQWTASYEALGELLLAQHEAYEPLRPLLLEQREALVADDFTRLERVNERLTAHLARLERARVDWGSELKMLPVAALGGAIREAPAAAADLLRPLHEELIGLAVVLHDLTSGNASLVRHGAAVTDNVLRSVRGWAQQTYEANGVSARSRLGSRAWTV